MYLKQVLIIIIKMFGFLNFSTPFYLSLYYLFGIIYPLFRSSRIARGKESEEAKHKILKYWVVFCLLKLVSEYLSGILSILDVSSATVSGLHVVLVVLDFYLAEWIYDNAISELFSKNEKLLHTFFK